MGAPVTTVDPDGLYVGPGTAGGGPASTQLPASLGAKTSAASLSVVQASDARWRVKGIGITGANNFSNGLSALPDENDVGRLLGVATFLSDGAAWDMAPGDSANGAIVQQAGAEYETVAASQTDQMLGASGAVGDYLRGLLVIPATTSPGEVSIEDGATNMIVFAGGASSINELRPIWIPLGIKSVSGGWEVTTGANVSVLACGNFT